MDKMQLRVHCLTEARMSFLGRPVSPDLIIETADKFYRFASGEKPETVQKRATKRR